jgi:hypothetical protein
LNTLGNLRLDAYAKPRDFVGLQSGDFLAAKAHRAARRLDLARQELEEGALAGAVRSD